MPITTLTNETLQIEIKDKWENASKLYGSTFSIPTEEKFSLNEYERAMHVLLVLEEGRPKGEPDSNDAHLWCE